MERVQTFTESAHPATENGMCPLFCLVQSPSSTASKQSAPPKSNLSSELRAPFGFKRGTASQLMRFHRGRGVDTPRCLGLISTDDEALETWTKAVFNSVQVRYFDISLASFT
jgi:hypothetical protein